MTTPWYDVIIVGGGPAGASAGLFLAQHGLRVLLFEKYAVPRLKPCGGGLTYRTLRRFPQLQPLIAPIILNEVSCLDFYAPDRSSLHYTYEEPISLMIQRSQFDAMFLHECQQAGVVIKTVTPVKQIRRTSSNVEVLTQADECFRANILIGADGTNSLVARQAGLRTRWQREQLALSLVAEIPSPIVQWHNQATMQIWYGFDGFGYGWVFPKQTCVNVGIFGLLNQKPEQRLTVLRRFLQTLHVHDQMAQPVETKDIRGGLLPIRGALPITQTDRVLLCGDAAGFVHAVTGEGIYYAMVSGELAAKTVLQAFQQRDFSADALACYQTMWQAELGEELAQAVHVQQRLLAYPHLLNTLVRTAAHHDGLKKAFTGYFMGNVSYPQLKRHLITHFLPQYLKLWAAKILRRT